MSDIIQNLINNVLEDGARPSKFRCEIKLPDGFETNEKNLDIICKSAIFPAKTNEVIFIKHKGRNIPIPGQERFGHTLDLTFYADAKHKFRSIFYEWAMALNNENYSTDISNDLRFVKESVDQFGLGAYKTNIKLTQLNFEGDNDEVAYNFYNVFPREVGQINLGSDSISAISEFSVAFSYTHFDIEKKEDGVNANDIANNILSEVQNTANKVVNKAMGYIENSDIGKLTNKIASKSTVEMQDIGKSIGTTIDEFLG
jgi:hypothetical protein